MKPMLALLILCGLTTATALALPPAPVGGTKGKFIVHEWGTFTGFAGSDGVHLPSAISVGGELPEFVLTRRQQAERQGVAIDRFGDFTKGAGLPALQRMENPVIYFYTDQAKEVTARVEFPRGLLSEFYPPVRAMTPPFGEGPGEFRYLPRPADAPPPATRPEPKLEKSSLGWGKFLIIPQLAGELPTYMPNVSHLPGAGAHYAHARATDAATIQFSDRPGERHDERFLFYRGLGDFSLPTKLTAQGNDRFEFSSTVREPIGFAILLSVSAGEASDIGVRARFTVYKNITGTQLMALPQNQSSLDEVAAALVEGLVAQGLFEREARAMVATWRHQWLGERGTRVLYTLPRPATDALLPLTITPAPDVVARVLIGRIDILTPEVEEKIQSMLAAAPKLKALPPEDAAVLQSVTRFLDPALDRAVELRGPAAADPKKERNALRSLFWNLPRPVAAGN